MASTSRLDEVDEQLKAVIDNLYILIAQSHEYLGSQTTHAMTSEIKRLIQNLLSLCHTARTVPTGLPAEIVDYVERSRNPDIYTREFVELVQKLNQQLKGRSQAFADFRDILAREIMSALPDCKQDIDMVLESTGANTRHTL